MSEGGGRIADVVACREVLVRAGWAARELLLLSEAGLVWQVTVAKGDGVLYREAACRAEAWRAVCRLARVVDLLDAGPDARD